LLGGNYATGFRVGRSCGKFRDFVVDSSQTDRDVAAAQRYFSSFASDYHRAFEGTGESLLHRTLNRLFRRKTFELRTKDVEEILSRHGVSGKDVLDVGCGSGEISLIAARLGAKSVRGFDIVPDMVAMASQQAAESPWPDRLVFEVRDIVHDPIPSADITLIVAVVEYYAEIEDLLSRVARATRELLLVVDTRGPSWRRALRYALARYKRFNLYYHPADDVSKIVKAAGFSETRRILGHSYTVMAFERASRLTE
jgi:2-polyprenyl-3-methyl-5-hydroxy-6-metoxy-1,4-benzoquinol methylase